MMGASTTLNSDKLELLITIVNREKADYYLDLIQSHECNMQLVAMAEGTASKDSLAMFGMSPSDKTVLFSTIREDKKEDLLKDLTSKFKSIKNGSGVAFTVPFSGMIGLSAFAFLSNNPQIMRGNDNG